MKVYTIFTCLVVMKFSYVSPRDVRYVGLHNCADTGLWQLPIVSNTCFKCGETFLKVNKQIIQTESNFLEIENVLAKTFW